MSSIRRLVAAGGVVTAICVLAACGPSDDNAGSASSPAAAASKASNKDDFKLPDLPKGLPTTMEQLKGWKWNDWQNWAENAAQDAFKNPLVKNLWDASRMKQAKPLDQEVKSADADNEPGISDPVPTPVNAQKVPTPYHQHAAPVGKVFFDSPDGPMVCSGTVVKDPAHPGKSNLVWTAGHCVHGGKDGGWYRNIQFVPSYNDDGKDLTSQSASDQEVAPYGGWWASWAQTSSQWIESGGETGGVASPYDFAILKVTPLSGGKSLEETVGSALPVWFNAPRDALSKGVSAYGYPAAPPFDGQIMNQCTDSASRLAMDTSAPTMERIGCTMTGGSSGGGWLSHQSDGTVALVSNTSIGPADNTWLAGPYLGDTAQSVFKAVSDKFANG
jgi:V8-like Glu-specific endopeptidase